MDYLLIARETYTDGRDGGAFWDRTVGYNTDLQGLQNLAARLTSLSAHARDKFVKEYSDFDHHTERKESLKSYTDKIIRHDPKYIWASSTEYLVREREPTGPSVAIYAGSDLFDD